MEIRNPNTTARQAADIFAATNWDDQRKVGCWLINPARFQLVGGRRWYRVVILSDYSGWQIVAENGEPITA